MGQAAARPLVARRCHRRIAPALRRGLRTPHRPPVLPMGGGRGDVSMAQFPVLVEVTLRPGAIARFSPVMGVIGEFARAGGPVLGVCNGFQVLTEAGLLPGALQKNRGLKFLCRTVEVRVDSTRSVLTSGASPGQVLHLPINHFEGNYTCSPRTLDELRAEERIVLRYVDNPNGATDAIAGICSPLGNVVGLMPHPERASDPLLGSTDGLVLLGSFL